MKKQIVAILLPLFAAIGLKAGNTDSTLLYLPINSGLERQYSTGSSVTIDGRLLERYPSIDILNSLTGIVPGLNQTEIKGSTGNRFGNANCSLNARNFTSIKFIVDDVLIPDVSQLQLNPEDIENITLVSDILDKARFGPEIASGAVYIRTMRGKKDGNRFKIGFESGLEAVDRFPEWVSGADYARLNNQARRASGVEERFSQADIAAYSKCDPLDKANPCVDYRDLILRNTRNLTKAYVLAGGELKNMEYSANIGYTNQGDIIAVGDKSDFNHFNANMHLGVNVVPQLRFDFNFLGNFSMRRSPMIGYNMGGRVYELPTALQYFREVTPVEYPLYWSIDEETGAKEYAITAARPNNPYAAISECGSYNETQRSAITDATITYNFGKGLKGLKSETHFGCNLFYLTRMGQSSDYVAYIYKEDGSRELTSHQGQRSSSKSTYLLSYLQNLQMFEKLSYNHRTARLGVDVSATYYRSKLAVSGSSSYRNQQNIITSASFDLDRRYLLEAVLNYAGSSALKKGNRYEAFPSIGLGWIISEEGFLRDSRIVDFLKLRAQAGILGEELYDQQYNWESQYSKAGSISFGPYPTRQWFGTSSSSASTTVVSRFSNDNLDWQKHRELSFGADAVLFGKLSLGVTGYRNLVSGRVVDVTSISPALFGPGSLFKNYEQTLYYGADFYASYRSKVGELSYSLGGSATLCNSVYKKLCESASYDYLLREGTSTGDVLAYDYMGKFTSQEEIDEAPKQLFAAKVQPGDLRYRDINNDGVVDSNDRTIIGNVNPKLRYSLNIGLSYRNFELNAVGTGCAFFNTFFTNVYFWNGTGDNNYSAFVRDNIGGAYPRLSYDSQPNNFINSQFWMRKGDFFKLQNAELAYTWNIGRGDRLKIRSVRFHLRGANLLTISGIRDVDPESTASGVTDYPLFRTFTGGFTVSF